MSPRRAVPFNADKGVLLVDWPLFGELSRALAVKVAREYDPEIIVGVATAGVVPGAVIAGLLDRPFHSFLVSRRFRADVYGDAPSIFGQAPADARGRRVLLVDETCDSGDTLRLAVGALINVGATEVRTAVSFRTGSYAPDFHGLATEAAIVLPWDREMFVDGELVPNPRYEGIDLT
jgi:hypoxanthine phosphoribosyltransferase